MMIIRSQFAFRYILCAVRFDLSFGIFFHNQILEYDAIAPSNFRDRTGHFDDAFPTTLRVACFVNGTLSFLDLHLLLFSSLNNALDRYGFKNAISLGYRIFYF